MFSLLLSYSFSSCYYSLHRSSLYSSSLRRYCLHLRGSSSAPSSGVFFSSTSSPSLSSSLRPMYLRRRLPIFESIRAACRPRRHIFFTNTCLVRILVKFPVAAVISQVFQRPPQCASIGCLSLAAPTTILRKLSSCGPFLFAGCMCGSVGRCFLPLCVLLPALLAEPSGLAGARSFFTQGKQFPNCQQNKLLVYA